MEQIEEFDSTSSSSDSSTSESSSNDSSGEDEEGESSCEAGESESQEDDGERGSVAGQEMAGLAAGVATPSNRSRGRNGSYQRSNQEDEGGRRRKRLRKRKATGLRKKLRTHIESVDEFNPEARSAQSAELERLRRLQLQQSLTQATATEPATAQQAATAMMTPTAYGGLVQAPLSATGLSMPTQQLYMSPLLPAQTLASGPPLVRQQGTSAEVHSGGGDSVDVKSRSVSSSPEVLMVDLTAAARMGEGQGRATDAIVIDSGSDSDNTNEQGRTLQHNTVATQQIRTAAGVTTTQYGGGTVATPTRSELLNMKYGEILPSPDGRVLVNAGHDSTDEDIFLAPQIAQTVKPHQIGGIRFLYDNIVESLTQFNSSVGFGCILAHSMGLGKTLQVISFIEVFLRCTSAKHVLCVVPVNTLQNWISEFDHWVPPPPTSQAKPGPSSGVRLLTNQNPLLSQVTGATPPTTTAAAGVSYRTNDVFYRAFNISILSEANKTMESRLKVIHDWRNVGGVLLLGYEMYRILSLSVPSLGGNKMAVKKKKNLVVKAPAGGTIDLDETEREMDALIEIQKALCNPGPDLVVCDEGHRIKNDYSNISQALKRIRTRRRIVMTGYPLQNNLTEYWCMVDFVRPNLLGTKQEFADLFERPITNGQCVDSTPMDVRLMRFRSHVLHSLLEGFVLRRGHEILKSTLPPKFEHVLFLRPSPVQGDLYNYNMSAIEHSGGTSSTAGPLKAFAVCSKIWNHPDIYYQEAFSQNSKRTSPTAWLDQEGLPKTITSSSGAASSSNANESACKVEWPSTLLPNYQPGLLESSPKMVLLIELIERSVQLGDKILIFSQTLNTLSYIEKLLGQRSIPIPNSTDLTGSIQYSNVKWAKNRNYCRLDGSTNSIERDRLINNFNSDKNQDCWVFLLSTKAGCLGINLIGANRVIVTDVSWNPCYDSQAVCRVYRYGQTKPCYIYRLVCDGTMERKIYDRQISKQSMSNRVVDELHPERHLTTQDILKLITPLAQLPPPSDLSSHAMEYLFDPLLMQICSGFGHLLTKLPFKHESLLIDSEEERMTEVEKYLAMKGFQQDLKAIRSNPGNPSAQGYRPQPGSTLQPRPPSSRPSATTGQMRIQTSYTGQTGHTGQTKLQQVRPYPQVPIPPVPEAVPSSSGLTRSGGAAAAPVVKVPNESVEVICLDSDDDDDMAVTRGMEPSRVVDPASLLHPPAHLQQPQSAVADLFPGTTSQTPVDPLPNTSVAAATVSASSPTGSSTADDSSALNLNMSHNNSISPLFNQLMASSKVDQQQQCEFLLAANQYILEASLYSYAQQAAASVAAMTSSNVTALDSSQLLPPETPAGGVGDAQSLSRDEVGEDSSQQVGSVEAVTTNSSNSLLSPFSATSSSLKDSTSTPLFQQKTQVFENTTPYLSLSPCDSLMSPMMTTLSSSLSNQLSSSCKQTLQVPEVHNNGYLSPSSSPQDTMHDHKSPSVSPFAQSSPSQFTPSPSSSSLSPLSPLHQTHTPSPAKTSQSITTPPSPPTSTTPSITLKLKRSHSHSAPVRNLAPALAKPLRKTHSSSPPKSYSLEQRFGSSFSDESPATGTRSSSVSPISALSPSQSNSSDCSSPPPERTSTSQNSSPPMRVENSVTFRYSSSPSPSNTPSAPYTPCSIPLLSPIAARLLYLSTGTQLPSSPPEDVDKLPPIVNKKLKPSSHSTVAQTASVVKKESGQGSDIPEKKLEKKKKKGSSLAKSMELVPTLSEDLSFPPATVLASYVTTPTSTTPTSGSALQKVAVSSTVVTTSSLSTLTPMLCSPLPLSRNSCSNKNAAVSVSSSASTANLWAPKSQSQLSVTSSHIQARVNSTEESLSKLLKMAPSSSTQESPCKPLKQPSPGGQTPSNIPTSVSRPVLSVHDHRLSVSTKSSSLPPVSAPGVSQHGKSTQLVWHCMSEPTFSFVQTVPSTSTAANEMSSVVKSPQQQETLPHRMVQNGSPMTTQSVSSLPHQMSQNRLPGTTQGVSSLLHQNGLPATIQSVSTLPHQLSQNGRPTTIQSVSSLPHQLPQSSSPATTTLPHRLPQNGSPVTIQSVSSLPHRLPQNGRPTTTQSVASLLHQLPHNGSPMTTQSLSTQLSDIHRPPSMTSVVSALLQASPTLPRAVARRSSNEITSPVLSAKQNTTEPPVSKSCPVGNTRPNHNTTFPPIAKSTGKIATCSSAKTSGQKPIVAATPQRTGRAQSTSSTNSASTCSSANTSGKSPIAAATPQRTGRAQSTSSTNSASTCSNANTSGQNPMAAATPQCTGRTQSTSSTDSVTSTPTTADSCPTEKAEELLHSSSGVLPDGLEHRVISGLLQAGPPIALNRIQGDETLKLQTVKASPSGGKGVVTAVAVPTSSTGVESSVALTSRKRCSSDSVSVSPSAVVTTSKPNPKSLKSKLSQSSALPVAMINGHSSLGVPSQSVQASSTPTSPTTAAAPVKQQASLSIRRKYSLHLAADIPQEGMAHLASNNGTAITSGSDCGGSFILSPSDLHSPLTGGSTLPELLKSFTFPISLSPPVDRKQLPTPSSSNTATSNQPSDTEQCLQKQLQVSDQNSLLSPDYLKKDTVQSGSAPILSPKHKTSSRRPVIVPNYQTKSPVQTSSRQRSGPLLSPVLQNGSPHHLQSRNAPVIVPAVKRNVHGGSRHHFSANGSVVSPGQQPTSGVTTMSTGCQSSANASVYHQGSANAHTNSTGRRNSTTVCSANQGSVHTLPNGSTISGGCQVSSANGFIPSTCCHGSANVLQTVSTVNPTSVMTSSPTQRIEHMQSGSGWTANGSVVYASRQGGSKVPSSNRQKLTAIVSPNSHITSPPLTPGSQDNPIGEKGVASGTPFNYPNKTAGCHRNKAVIQTPVHESVENNWTSAFGNGSIMPPSNNQSASSLHGNNITSILPPSCQGMVGGNLTMLPSALQSGFNSTVGMPPSKHQTSVANLSASVQLPSRSAANFDNTAVLPSIQQGIAASCYGNSMVLAGRCPNNTASSCGNGTVVSFDHQNGSRDSTAHLGTAKSRSASAVLPSTTLPHSGRNNTASCHGSITSQSFPQRSNCQKGTAISQSSLSSALPSNYQNSTTASSHTVLPFNLVAMTQRNSSSIFSAVSSSDYLGSPHGGHSVLPPSSHKNNTATSQRSNSVLPASVASNGRNDAGCCRRNSTSTRQNDNGSRIGTVLPSALLSNHENSLSASPCTNSTHQNGRANSHNTVNNTGGIPLNCQQRDTTTAPPKNDSFSSPNQHASGVVSSPVYGSNFLIPSLGYQNGLSSAILSPTSMGNSAVMPPCSHQNTSSQSSHQQTSRAVATPTSLRNCAVPSFELQSLLSPDHQKTTPLVPSQDRNASGSVTKHRDGCNSLPTPLDCRRGKRAIPSLNLQGHAASGSSISSKKVKSRNSTALSRSEKGVSPLLSPNLQRNNSLQSVSLQQRRPSSSGSMSPTSRGNGTVLSPNLQTNGTVPFSNLSRPDNTVASLSPQGSSCNHQARHRRNSATGSSSAVPVAARATIIRPSCQPGTTSSLQLAGSSQISSLPPPPPQKQQEKSSPPTRNSSVPVSNSNGTNITHHQHPAMAQVLPCSNNKQNVPQSQTETLWDASSLSFLSDLFTPEPPTKQRHRSDSYLPSNHPQTSLKLSVVGSGRVVRESVESQASQSGYLPTSVAPTGMSGDELLNDLLSACQDQSIPPCPPKRPLATRPQTLPNVQKNAPPSQPSMSSNSSCLKSMLPRQQQQDLPSISRAMSHIQPYQTVSVQLPQTNDPELRAHFMPPSNGPELSQQNHFMGSVNGMRNSQVCASQASPLLSTPAACLQPQGQQQQLLSPHQSSALPSLPKLTPLSSQMSPRLGPGYPVGGQSSPVTPVGDKALHTSKCKTPVTAYAMPQQQRMAESAVLAPPPPAVPVCSDNHLTATESDTSDQNLNLLSILNSLSPSQLESLLNMQASVSNGNDRQSYLHSTTKAVDAQPSASHLQTTSNAFHNSSPNPVSILPHLPSSNAHLSHLPNLPATNHGPVLPPRSKVAAASAKKASMRDPSCPPPPQFLQVRSSCTSTGPLGAGGQLFNFAALPSSVCGHGALPGSVVDGGSSVLMHQPCTMRVHSARQTS